jgi:hypothetical protein
LFEYLDNNKEVSDINSEVELVYETNKELIDTLNEATTIKE